MIESAITQKVAEDYWIKHLNGVSYSQLYTYMVASPVFADAVGEYAEIPLALSGTMLNSLKGITKGDRKSIFALLITALAILHSRYTGASDILLNSPDLPADNAASAEKKLFYRINIPPDCTTRGLLNVVKQNLLDTFEHRDYNPGSLLERFRNNNTGNEKALSQLGIYLESLHMQPAYDNNNEIDFIFDLEDTSFIRFKKKLFDEKLILQYAGHFLRILSDIFTGNNAIGEVELLDEEQQHMLLHTFNNNKRPLPPDTDVISLLERICLTYPDGIAVQTLERKLTFGELKQYSDNLAAHLKQQFHLEKEQVVGLMFDRNEWAIIAMVGILKAGGVYFPLDPKYPDDRLQYMIGDSGCQLVLTEKKYIDTLEVNAMLDISSICSHAAASRQETWIAVPFQLAYVIYTSGSTGRPKGTLIQHSSLLNHIAWFNRQFSVNRNDSTLLVTSYSFDGSVTYIWSCLTTGATLHMLPDDKIIDPSYLLRYIQSEGVTFLKLVPSFFALLINNSLFEEADVMKSIRFIKQGGEAINVAHVKKYMRRYPQTLLANHYGATEATIGSTVHLITPDSIQDFERVPVIGKPFDNCKVYILGKRQELLPPGVIGEIYVGGAGVGRGYLNRPALTAEKFVELSYANGERVYRTGDMGCWTPDGTILFKGREDFQVKIKGYRIELPEIEIALQQYDAVEQAVVLPGEDNQSLTGYICGSPEIKLTALRAFLLTRLPEFMIPATFVLVDHIPMTLNRKADRSALALIKGRRLEASDAYVAPETRAELTLVTALESIFRNRPIGIEDHFFSLGGDSIKAILLVSRVKQAGYTLGIPDILNFPVVKEMAARMVKSDVSYSQEAITGSVPLGPAQIAFLESNIADRNAFHQSVILFNKGGFDEAVIRESLSVLWTHHDALRMKYSLGTNGWEQICEETTAKFGWEVGELKSEAHWERIVTDHHRKLIGALTINGPLLQAALLHCPDGDRLLLVIHHLVVDGVSWRIMLEDLSSFYQQGIQGQVPQAPKKTASIKRWQENLIAYAHSEQLMEEAPYWDKVLSAGVSPLPVDMQYTASEVEKDTVGNFTLDEEHTAKLTSGIHTAYKTNVNDVLLTALAITVKEIFDRTQFMILLEGHGREDVGEPLDVSRTVGWFTAKYPVLLDLGRAIFPEEQLVAVKETLHNIPLKGLGYGVLRYLNRSALNTSQRDTFKPAVVFNYLGDFDATSTTGMPALFTITNDLLDKQVMNTGDEQAPLRVSAIIVRNCLQLSVSYSSRMYQPATINRLLSRYKAHLMLLIESLSGIQHNILTPSDLSFKGMSVQQLNSLNKDGQVEDIYPLTPLQQGLYFFWLMDPSSYLQQMVYSIQGALDLSLLEKCYNALLQRHDVLRVSNAYLDSDHVVQIVKHHRHVPLTYIDMSVEDIGQEELPQSLEQYKRDTRRQGIDLHQDNLFALTVIKYSDKLHGLVWRWHHIICDGWSMSIIMAEFIRMYATWSAGRQPALTAGYAYGQYIKWLQQVNKENTLIYWRKYLEDYNSPAILPLLDTRSESDYRFREMYLWLKNEKADKVREFCKQKSVTENTFFTALWAILLAKYNNSNDVVFGTVVSGRPPEVQGIEHMVGLFINTIPVRVRLNLQGTVTDLMSQIREDALASAGHHYVQLADIQSCSILNKSLLNHILIFENYPVDEEQRKSVNDMEVNAGLSIRAVNETRQNQTNYPFNIVIRSDMSGIEVAFTFNELVLAEEIVKQIMSDLENLTEQVLLLPENKLLNFQFNLYFKNAFANELIAGDDLEESF
ncbi:non-ribosomal peptide synthetase [Chitinophaga sp. S165]|uniref:non-ribosomal peptide synthetase n=1 Tax=Chitinophaga sp. S165 TaxID=2135462 RepID=UPI000D717FAC|nr:non-ribosomal peptide synthetase [Chitinophaga sp. S165]PWV46100.1 non-ribosomal peptide synthase protein (TIGR01720 family)/amino acid adenylation domain-containing protein [Chitinophaga sp. S165]